MPVVIYVGTHLNPNRSEQFSYTGRPCTRTPELRVRLRGCMHIKQNHILRTMCSVFPSVTPLAGAPVRIVRNNNNTVYAPGSPAAMPAGGHAITRTCAHEMHAFNRGQSSARAPAHLVLGCEARIWRFVGEGAC